ncbi:cadherin-like beta sandwich domain-containing protein, partial [Odoribacter sp. OttesenSCG-928-L07]|nr:cadherin-like beta sandwich domain-containing protein [Odoribacter sp. OttesenSCG-928-L07]
YAGTGDYPEKDGGADGFDCVSTMGVAKNILTVGAVNKVSNYTGPSSVVMSSFSGWGPADDGRIKPDIVAAGVSLYSSGSNSDTHYSTKSGTSMSTPNTTGSLVLLLHYYEQIYETSMRSSTIKAIAIHTAEECGPNEGPDYMFGWGLLNVEKGANLINDNEEKNSINELTLNENQTFERYISVEEGEPLRATICWIDPPGTANNSLNNRTPVLVNDLDIKIVDESENIYYPYKLSPYFPSAAATKNSTNDVDNVEQVYIANPSAGIYKIIVTHKGSLQGGSQDFSLITSYLPGESLSDDDLLSDLTVSHGTLIPAFDGNITNYSVEVENNVTNIEIIATTNHPNASVAGDGNKILAVGSNQFDIVVTAQNGISTKSYSISVYREASDDATLSNLAVNQGELTPNFNPNTTSYTVNVLNNITNIEITGTANHINAQVVGNGEKPLNVGANPFDIIVTAEDNITTLTYNVVVYREAIYYVLSSSVNGSGGSIEPIGEIEVEQGSNQDYNITPITGFKISSVLIDGINNPSAVESGVYSFENVTSNHSIIVAFEPIDFMITAEAGEGGNIVPSGIIQVNYGENQTFMFEASANFIIESVLIDGENIPEAISDGKYTFEYVTQNHNISVTFKQNAGIDDNDNTLMLYPNPTKNKFVVKTSLEIIGKVMLYNMAGSLLFEENVQNNSVEIDLSNYSAGVYFLNVEGKQLKVIKQ